MDRSTKLLILQGAGITLHIINAQIGVLTHSAAIALIVGAVVGGFQFVVQNLGNKTPVEPK